MGEGEGDSSAAGAAKARAGVSKARQSGRRKAANFLIRTMKGAEVRRACVIYTGNAAMKNMDKTNFRVCTLDLLFAAG